MSTTNELQSLWNNVLAQMKTRVSQANYFTLFKNTYLVSLEDDIATIAAPSNMIINMLHKRFEDEIKELLINETGKKDILLLFIPKAMPVNAKEKETVGPLFPDDTVSKKETKPLQPVAGHLPRVRSDYTFSNFAVSGSNQLAFVSSQTVADNIGKSYNPLFIYGPVGVGKTHLMHAVANSVYQTKPEKKIVYITSEEFTNEVIEAIRTNDTAKMKRRFRSAYLLLIDDIQFIEGKERVQEELFHTFNILIDNGSQICLSSDRPPHEIKRIEKRLSSRFSGGLTVDIGPPDLELKTAIIGLKAKKFGYEITPEVALFLAEQAEDTRSLEGLLLRVVTQAATSNIPLSIDMAKKSLGAIQEEKKSKLHVEDIINEVCEYYRIKPTQLKGPKRDASLVKARQVCMYILKHELELPFMEIGNVLGGRDHTTIMHGVEKISFLVDNKAAVYEDIQGITRQLRG